MSHTDEPDSVKRNAQTPEGSVLEIADLMVWTAPTFGI